jgi:prepilin-type N-terminal cleavage/methylation domain-containing protein
MKFVLHHKMLSIRNGQRGMTLIELMISMVVLAIGLAGITILLIIAIGTNNRNSRDTTATMLAQLVIEEIQAQDPNSTVVTIPITDCANNSFTIAVTSGAAPAGAGANLVTNAASINYGGIDQSQAVLAIPAGYQMSYVDCSAAGGVQTTYDVRWNVMTVSATNTRLITASARQLNSSSTLLGGRIFALPVNLRGIGGHTQF